MAVPGWPLPAFWTASAASNRAVSTARTSTSVHPATAAIGAASDASRFRFVLAWSTSEEFRLVTDGAYPQKDRGLCRVLSGARAPNDARLLLLHGRPVSMGSASGPHHIPEDAVTALEPRLDPVSTWSGDPGWRQTLGHYVALTKPRIIELLLLTTFHQTTSPRSATAKATRAE